VKFSTFSVKWLWKVSKANIFLSLEEHLFVPDCSQLSIMGHSVCHSYWLQWNEIPVGVFIQKIVSLHYNEWYQFSPNSHKWELHNYSHFVMNHCFDKQLDLFASFGRHVKRAEVLCALSICSKRWLYFWHILIICEWFTFNYSR
jgi:hypothetical protein